MASRLAVAATLLFASVAAADRPRTTVLPFAGPQGARAQQEAIRAIRSRAEIVSATEWETTAKRIAASSRNADDVAAVAKELNVAVVVTGSVKRDGGWVLSVTVRNGPTGKAVERLKYPLRGPRLDPATLRRMAEELPDAVAHADAAGAPPPEAAAPPPEEENPLAKKEEKPDEERIERPAWTPYLDATVGLLLTGRKLSFSETGQPAFNSQPLVGALRVDATFYPLAALATRPGGAVNAITGIGLGATFDYVFYGDAAPPADQQTQMICGGAPPCHFPVSEIRLEAGLRWHWNFLQNPHSPELLIKGQFGFHDFTIGKRNDGTSIVPSVTYQYLDVGAGLAWRFVDALGASLAFDLLVPFSTGEIQTPAEFGPGGAIGFRPSLGLDLRPYRGLTVRAGGFVEYYSLSFANSGTSARVTTGSASDLYWGLVLSIGYVF